jgi:hypothetical protein
VIDRVSHAWPRLVSGAAILAVAAVAGLISYTHIEDLTLTLHQSIMVARLMPIGVDGLVAVGSVVLVQSGHGQRWLGWLGIGPGVAISLFANVESGIRYGWLSATWAGIPAVSFFLASFILENWLKSQARAAVTIPAPDDTVLTVADAVPVIGPVDVPVDDVPPVPARRVRAVAANRARRRRAQSLERVFAAEIERGELPSIREVKRRARCGTPRAGEIRDSLAAILREAQPDAA